jgi:carbamoyl-phosphate synthase small subunit
MTEAGANLDIRRPYVGEDLPAVLEEHVGMLVLGGAMNAVDEAATPWLAATKTLVRAAVDADLPLLGICLGHQIMALASGAQTVKMKFGHHGANHPVQDLDSGKVLITSQNHGFAVDADSLPANCRVTHVSLFDGSLQGFERTDKPAFCFQGHPEASPGPHDLRTLFDRFISLMEARHA